MVVMEIQNTIIQLSLPWKIQKVCHILKHGGSFIMEVALVESAYLVAN